MRFLCIFAIICDIGARGSLFCLEMCWFMTGSAGFVMFCWSWIKCTCNNAGPSCICLLLQTSSTICFMLKENIDSAYWDNPKSELFVWALSLFPFLYYFYWWQKLFFCIFLFLCLFSSIELNKSIVFLLLFIWQACLVKVDSPNVILFFLFLIGDITQKGYEKKRSKLIGAYFPQTQGKTDFLFNLS